MDIDVFTPEYQYLGIISTPTSIMYTEKFQSLGNFELHLPINQINTSLIKKDRVLLFDKVNQIAGIVGIIKKSKSTDSTDELVVTGNLCEEYLYRRICWGLYTKTGKASDIIKDMVTTQVISPEDPDRAIPDIILDPAKESVGPSVSFQSTGGVVGENIENLCSSNSLGFKMKFDATNKQMLFYVYKGTDRTIQQKIVPPCKFSSVYENILSLSYSLNSQDWRNVALVAGEGEGLERKMVSVGAGSGKYRKEVFVDARDLQSTNIDGMTISEDEYFEMLKQRGNSRLSELREAESFDCIVNSIGNIRYNKDYFLGDTVTISDAELNIQLNAVVTEAEHAYDSNGESLYITFGYGQMTLDQKLKTKVVG